MTRLGHPGFSSDDLDVRLQKSEHPGFSQWTKLLSAKFARDSETQDKGEGLISTLAMQPDKLVAFLSNHLEETEGGDMAVRLVNRYELSLKILIFAGIFISHIFQVFRHDLGVPRVRRRPRGRGDVARPPGGRRGRAGDLGLLLAGLGLAPGDGARILLDAQSG